MSNNKFNLMLSIILIAAAIGTSSCSNSKTTDTKNVAEEHNDAKFDKSGNEKDAQFLVNVAEIYLEEISLGQLAQQKATNTHVKELGEMLAVAHTKSLADLTALAQTKSISLPTSQTEQGIEEYKKLFDKSGNDFGKAYSSMMVNGHTKAIEIFEKAATESTDPDIKALAAATLPTLRAHLDQALLCQTECNKL